MLMSCDEKGSRSVHTADSVRLSLACCVGCPTAVPPSVPVVLTMITSTATLHSLRALPLQATGMVTEDTIQAQPMGVPYAHFFHRLPDTLSSPFQCTASPCSLRKKTKKQQQH